MLFSIYCLDRPSCQSLRLTHRPAHMAYMMNFRDRLVLLGPLLAADGIDMVGSLIIIDQPDLTAVRTLLANDPYTQANLFESVVIRPFRMVLPEE